MLYEIKELTKSEIKHHFIKIRYTVIDQFPPIGQNFILKVDAISDTVKIDKLSRLWPHHKLNDKIIWEREANLFIIKESDNSFILKQEHSKDSVYDYEKPTK